LQIHDTAQQMETTGSTASSNDDDEDDFFSGITRSENTRRSQRYVEC
jgi:hypothetical protein